MPYLFKLSKRVARSRTGVVLVGAVTLLAACETRDVSSVNAPAHPSFATSTGLPAAVSDLAVAGMTDSSATLTFTEVDNGTGAPAGYDIRVAPTPLVWGGTAPSVKRGTCASPLAGTAIGAKRVCTVLGLTTGTAYDFQLVAYRGTLMVDAAFGPLSNVASGTARTPVVTAPGSVTDLSVAGATDTVITLSFTDVTGGDGRPASYDLRYIAGTTLNWGGSASVSRGTCAVPLAGTTIGAKRTCTVTGLLPASPYAFQLVAYRGTLNVNAVFGALSNVATGTTAATTSPPVNPGTVSDLTVSGTADTSLTLSFTEVNDGAGKPASYDVRYIAGSSMPWGGVASVGRGTCAAPMAGTTIGAKRSCSVLGLTRGTTYTVQLVAYRGSLNANAVFGGLSNTASGATTASNASGGGSGGGGAPGGGTVLVQENFADGAFAARGWYDAPDMPVTTAQHVAGATAALELHLAPGAVQAPWGPATRHQFQPTSTLYISYWVKYSDNWVGSGSMDHPHEFYVLSNQDGQYAALANDWLTTYIETNFVNGSGTPRISLQDNLAINRGMGTTPLNLIGVTENRSVSGCNGLAEANVVWDCYGSGTYNDKQFNRGATPVFQAQPGAAGYKGNWNHVEVYLQMNSIVNGVAVPDGVLQYWFNGGLVINRHDVMLRTGARANLAFAQFVIGPYIGVGSPADQYMWIDNLTLATKHP